MRKSRWRRTITGFLIGILGIGLIGTASHADKLGEAEAEKRKLEERRDEVEEELADLEIEKSNIMASIEKMDKKMEKVDEKLQKIKENVEVTTEELEKVSEELVVAEEQEVSQYETMKKRIKYMYENGSAGYMELIFEGKNISDVLNRMEYVNKITAYDNQMLEKYKETKLEVLEKKNQVSEKKSKYETLQEEAKLEQETLEKIVKKKEAEINKYDESISATSEEVRSFEEEIAKKEAEIEALLLEQAKNSDIDISDYVKNNGSGFRWPLSIRGTITSRFGKRKAPTAGASTYHKGIDIAAPTGVSILAAKGGTVVTSTYSPSAGNYIMISHGNGFNTVYMHASKRIVKVGDKVAQGQKIAEVGSTGYSTGPHLHFGIIVKGNYVNPEPYLSK